MDIADSGGNGPQQSRTHRAPPVVAIIGGPTASGKSALAIALAKRVNGHVINADSAQVYRDLAILSARPDAREMGDIPHRLFGHVDGAEDYSAARWAQEAKAEIAAASSYGRLPVLVGGTGLYLRTLIDGIAPVPDIDPAIRRAVRALSVEQAYAALSDEDPQAAQRLNAGDTTRVARALEVVRSTGRSLSDWQAEKTGGIGGEVTVNAAILLPPREWLFERCDRRFSEMMDHGAIDEIEALLARDLPADSPVMRAIGVREIAAMLRGDITRDAAIEQATLATRQYAKRQYTWFRNQPPADWNRIDTLPDPDLIEQLADMMAGQLAA